MLPQIIYWVSFLDGDSLVDGYWKPVGCEKLLINAKKSPSKIWKRVMCCAIFAPAIREQRFNERIRWEWFVGWKRKPCIAIVLQDDVGDKGVEKKLSNFFMKMFGVEWKVPIFAAAFGIRKTFGVDRSMPWSPDDWNEVLKKKFEKRCKKIWRGE